MQALTTLSAKAAGWLPTSRRSPGPAVAPVPTSAGAGVPVLARSTGSGLGEAGASVSGHKLEIYVLGSVDDGLQGLHAAAHGTLLYLFEKGASAEEVDVKVLGEVTGDHWLASKCPGGELLMPVVHELADDSWHSGPAAIWEMADRCLPHSRDLGRPVSQLSGGEVVLGDMASGEQLPEDSLMGALEKVLTSADEEEAAAAEKHLKATLQAMEDWLAEHEMAFIGGDQPNATDCYVVAELAHIISAGNLRRPGTLGQYPRLARYFEEWESRPSWRQSRFDEELVESFWRHRILPEAE